MLHAMRRKPIRALRVLWVCVTVSEGVTLK